MKIEMIDVQTSNKKHATDIAILVDKLEFLQELQRLREKWQITELIGSSLEEDKALLYCTKLSKKEAEKRLPEFNGDVDSVLKTFNRGKNFRPVVLSALITNTVPERVYKSCYFDIITINEAEDINKPEKYQYVIVMSPRTEKQEVVQAYKEFQTHIKGYEAKNEYEMSNMGKIEFEKLSNDYKFSMENPDDVEIIEHYYKGNVYNSANIDKFKTQKELERTREWYWMRYEDNLNGLREQPLEPAEVCKEWQNRCPINKDKKLKKKEYCNCIYCTTDPVVMMKALSHYDNLLKFS